MKKVIVLGASGSIGTQSLQILQQYPHEFELVGVSIGKNTTALFQILKEFPTIKVVYAIENIELNHLNRFSGIDGIVKMIEEVEFDYCINALVGEVGFLPSLAVLKKNRRLLLANKESLVIGGFMIQDLLKNGYGELIPIDSEHTGVLKCLKGHQQAVKEIVITASGGALRNYSRDAVYDTPIELVLNHPTWKMGPKITLDSATMMNKVFEVIEAYYLFGLKPNQIKVVQHDESLVHAFVQFEDGSYLSDFSSPDMKRPILYALFNQEIATYQKDDENLLAKTLNLHLAPLDQERFPLIKLAYRCLNQNLLLGTVLNTSNDIVTKNYLNTKIPFGMIEEIIFKTFQYMEKELIQNAYPLNLESIFLVKEKTIKFIQKTYQIGE